MKNDTNDFFIVHLLKNKVWISIALFCLGLLCLKISGTTVIFKFILWILPNLGWDFVENVFSYSGTIMLISSFGAFYFWLTSREKKRKNNRKIAMKQAAQAMNWNFSESLTSDLRRHVESLLEDILFTVHPNLICRARNVSHILSNKINGDLIAIFDFELSGSDEHHESSFAIFETAYFIVSKQIELPYFQTQAKIKLGVKFFENLLNTRGGVTEIEFPNRPQFNEKYILCGEGEKVRDFFTPIIFDFYEQNLLYRTIGRDKMLCLTTLQTETIDQTQINQNLQTLQRLYQLLKISESRRN